MEPVTVVAAATLPMWAQLLAALATPLAVLGTLLWTIRTSQHKLSITDADRRKDEIDSAVKRAVDNMNGQLTQVRDQLREEKAECKETTNKLEARVERYEGRLHTAESEKNKLGTQVAELKGKQFVMERMMPQFDILMGHTKAGGKRDYDPPAGTPTNEPNSEL